MKKCFRLITLVLVLCLALCFGALAEGINGGETEGVFKQGGYAGETGGNVYFLVSGTDITNLYSVPSVGGDIELIESQDDISELVCVGGGVYYLRYVNGYWQLVCREGMTLNILHVFAAGAEVTGLGYCDGRLYAINNGWLFSFDAVTGESALVTETQMSEYYIMAGSIYFVSEEDQRTYSRAFSDNSETVTVTAGCLYRMDMDGTNVSAVMETGISDLRGYGEYLYYHNYADNYFVAASDGKTHWLDGKIYRVSIVTGMNSKAYDKYDWDYYPSDYGLMLYTQMSVDLWDVDEQSGIQLMMPEVYTSVKADGEFAYVYEHTAQSMTKLPLNGEISILLGEGLPDDLVGGTHETVGAYVENADGVISSVSVYADEITSESEPVAAAKNNSSNSYIFPESSTRKLTTSDLKKVKCSLWAYGRNEIYARHGYQFKNSAYAEYFGSQKWYKAGGFDTTDLNEIEWYNMEFIKSYEDQYAAQIEAEKGGKEASLKKTNNNNTSSSSSSGSKSTVKKTDSSYIFPNSSKELLTVDDILSIDRSLWGYARNEIYARHGYEFKKATYANYFAKKTWYKPGGFSTTQLNSIEWKNMELIKKMEAKY